MSANNDLLRGFTGRKLIILKFEVVCFFFFLTWAFLDSLLRASRVFWTFDLGILSSAVVREICVGGGWPSQQQS